MIKGAPEVVLKMCSFYMNRGEVHPIDQQFRDEFQVIML